MRQSAITGAAAVSYAATCALGTAVALRLVDTSGFRWLHHALYLATFVLTAVAVSGAATPRPTAARSALLLAPALAPLAAIPYLGSRSRRHPIAALTAAPFYLASLLASRR